MKVLFGDLPPDAQAMLTRHLRIDFSQCDFKAPRWFSAWARNDAGQIIGIFAIEFPVLVRGQGDDLGARPTLHVATGIARHLHGGILPKRKD